MSDEEFYVPKAGQADRTESTFGFDPPQQVTTRNGLVFEEQTKREYRKYSKDQLASLGAQAKVKVPTWWEVCMIQKAYARTQYRCRDHEKDATVESVKACAECQEHAMLRREYVDIQFVPHPEVESTNAGKIQFWRPRLWWGVNDLTDEQLKAKRKFARDEGANYEGLVMATRRNRRLIENMLVALGREGQLLEGKKLDCLARIKPWEALAESGLNVLKVQFQRVPQGENTQTEPIAFDKLTA